MQVIHIKQPRRKTYSLQFDHEGNLVVRTDKKYFAKQLNGILKKHRKWIKENFIRVSKYLKQVPKIKIINGEKVSVFGKTYTFQIERVSSTKESIEFVGRKIVIKVPRSPWFSKEDIQDRVVSFLKKHAKKTLTERSAIYAEKYNFKFNRVTIKDQKTKWGSCSSLGNLNYNWHLIFAPLDIIDYVVIHELCHLKEMNHSSRFWKLVGKECPDYEKKRDFLRENEYKIRVRFS